MLSLGRSSPPGAEPVTSDARAAERISVVDLHIHTTCSDGVLSPEAVVERAAGRGLRAIASMDHDTVDGNAEAVEAGRLLGVAVIPGVEISEPVAVLVSMREYERVSSRRTHFWEAYESFRRQVDLGKLGLDSDSLKGLRQADFGRETDL